jgi:tetratricopeptide (TPR) repeat protein
MECADKIIDQGGNYGLQGYITKGSCLDYLGETRESIKLFQKGLKKFGDQYLLYYNIGVNYFKLEEYDKAEEAFVNAINANPEHSSSHLLLGYLMANKKLKIQSILCLHYFLFLEPDSERSKAAFKLLKSQFGGNVERNQDDPTNITIFMDPNQSKTEFGAANLMVSMLAATKYSAENEGKSEEELFIENTASFFKILGELKDKKNKGLWWDFYVPFFYDLANSDQLESYCYYISQSSSEAAQEWLSTHPAQLESLDGWLKEH